MTKALDWENRIGRRVRLRDLHILFAVAQHGSMAKAGAHLGMTQSSVSQAIAALEHALDARLLDRTKRGVEPTIYGNALLKRARIAFDELRQGVKEIEFLSEHAAGEVRIGCPEAIAAGILPPIIEHMSQRYPRVNLQVLNWTNVGMDFTVLYERTVDLVLSQLPKPLEDSPAEDLKSEVLFYDQICLATGLRSPWARRRKIDLADLVDARWMMAPSEALGASAVKDAFRARGLEPPQVSVATYSIHLRNFLSMSGRFIAAVPASVLRLNAELFFLKRLPIELPMPPWPVAIVMLKNRTLSPVVERFIECAREVAKSIAPGPKTKASRHRLTPS
jgi:DNA-binding transcriptional LysR family regulator